MKIVRKDPYNTGISYPTSRIAERYHETFPHNPHQTNIFLLRTFRSCLHLIRVSIWFHVDPDLQAQTLAACRSDRGY